MIEELNKLEKKAEEKSHRLITSLSELRGQAVNVELELPDGEVVQIPIHTLTYAEWQRIEREVPQPPVPVLHGAKGSMPDRNDPEYQKAMSLWNEQVMYRRVLAALEIEIEGATADEKVKNLQETISTPMMMGLIAALSQAHFANRAQVVARSKTFHNGG
jgi:hypothetical protein